MFTILLIFVICYYLTWILPEYTKIIGIVGLILTLLVVGVLHPISLR